VPSGKWLEFAGGVISGLFNQPGPALPRRGDHAMTTDSMRAEDDAKLFVGDAWSDPIEAGIRDRIRGFIEELIEEELAAALDEDGTNAASARRWRSRPGRRPAGRRGGRCLAARRSPARSSPATDHRLVRDRRDRRAAGANRWCGRRDRRVEEPDAAALRPDESRWKR
jgi:hypothetical protein